MEPLRSQEQNARFHALVSLFGLSDEEKRELVTQRSGGRTDSSKMLFRSEMTAAIVQLEGRYKDRIVRMRSKVNHLSRTLGYIKGSDYTRRDGFIQDKFHVKNLFEVPAEKLPDLITALEAVQKHRVKRSIAALLA